MDETLETMLQALEGLDAPSVTDRVSALDALAAELPQLTALSAQEWDVKLASIEDDIEELGELADAAAARLEQARRALETLKRFAQRRGAQLSLLQEVRPASPSTDDGRAENPVAQAQTTREAILQVMARRPHREWTPTAITDDLMRYGRAVARSNVQVTLRRLAGDGHVRKVGRGAYQVLSGTDGPGDDIVVKAPAKKGGLTASGRWTAEEASERARKAAETRRKNKEAGRG